MAAAEEVLYFICTKGDGAMGLTARTWMGRIWLGFGFRGSPLLYLSRALQECRERSQSLLVRHETASPGMCSVLVLYCNPRHAGAAPHCPGMPWQGQGIPSLGIPQHGSMASGCPPHTPEQQTTHDPQLRRLLLQAVWFKSLLSTSGSFQTIKSLMIAPSSLHSGFTSAFVADVPVYKLPQTQPEQDKPFPPCSLTLLPDPALPRRAETSSPAFRVPGSQGNQFSIEPFILQISKHFVETGPVGKQSCYLCDQ